MNGDTRVSNADDLLMIPDGARKTPDKLQIYKTYLTTFALVN